MRLDPGTRGVAHLYGIELGAAQVVAIAAALGVLSFYSPGIPSGGLFIMAHVAGQCFSCHTDRNLMDGTFTGPPFAGGHPFPSTDDPSVVYVSANLTPDPETGVLARWSEDDFVARFRAGPILPGSSMPWGAFARIAEDDVRAIYRYLDSLDPIHHDVGPVVRETR